MRLSRISSTGAIDGSHGPAAALPRSTIPPARPRGPPDFGVGGPALAAPGRKVPVGLPCADGGLGFGRDESRPAGGRAVKGGVWVAAPLVPSAFLGRAGIVGVRREPLFERTPVV